MVALLVKTACLLRYLQNLKNSILNTYTQHLLRKLDLVKKTLNFLLVKSLFDKLQHIDNRLEQQAVTYVTNLTILRL